MIVLNRPSYFFSLLLTFSCFACGLSEGNSQNSSNNPETPVVQTANFVQNEQGNYQLSDPHTSENLQIFMIMGKAELAEKKYLSLEKALASKKAHVVETGSVNELKIDNNSDEYIFIHSGDIVKGGKQDRTLSYDVIIPPNAKNVALESFCVEQGRWRKRGNEALGFFSSSKQMLTSRELKLSAKYAKNQHKVWENVAKQQDALSRSLSNKKGSAVDISNTASQSSLQLALENKDLNKVKEEMDNKFAGLLETYPNAIGFAYAINGEVYGVDVYNNRALFQDLWPRLLASAIVEAISETKTTQGKHEIVKQEAVLAFMEAVQTSQPKTESKNLNKSTILETTENSERNLLFSTLDQDKGTWVHRNYMKSEEEKESPVLQINRSNYPIQQRIIQTDSLRNQLRN